MKNSDNMKHNFPRRGFLKLGTAGTLGLTLADQLRQEAWATAQGTKAAANSVILLWLAGGPSTIDMWDMKPDAPEFIRGQFKPIKTSIPGVSICEHLPKTSAVLNRCTLIRSLTHGIDAHGPGTVHMATGHPPLPALQHPALGSLAAYLLPGASALPSYVSLSFDQVPAARVAWGAGFLGVGYNPFEIDGNFSRRGLKLDGMMLPDDFTVEQLDRRSALRSKLDQHFRLLDQSDLPASLDRFQQQALDILRSNQMRSALNLDQEKDTLRESYGRSAFGQNVLAARRLVEAGARFVTVGLGGWDTHDGNFPALQNQLLPQLDRALSALITDLELRGLLETTIVYCAGEFGRTPAVNKDGGRDHWARAMSVLLAGGGFRPGCIHGSTDHHAAAPIESPCSPSDVAATIFQALGIPPERQIRTNTGRPLSIFRDAKVIHAIRA